MYQRRKRYQEQVACLANARAAKERKRLNSAIPADRVDLPDLRRVVEITDYDTGSPVTHRIELYRNDCIDRYNIKIHVSCGSNVSLGLYHECFVLNDN